MASKQCTTNDTKQTWILPKMTIFLIFLQRKFDHFHLENRFLAWIHTYPNNLAVSVGTDPLLVHQIVLRSLIQKPKVIFQQSPYEKSSFPETKAKGFLLQRNLFETRCSHWITPLLWRHRKHDARNDPHTVWCHSYGLLFVFLFRFLLLVVPPRVQGRYKWSTHSTKGLLEGEYRKVGKTEARDPCETLLAMDHWSSWKSHCSLVGKSMQ